MQLFQEKKPWVRCFPASFPKKQEDLFCRTCLNGYMSEMNQKKKNLFTKSVLGKTPVMASFLVQLQPCWVPVFPKSDFISDPFL